MRKMMKQRYEEQQIRAFSRAIEWSERERLAQEARDKGAPYLARRQVAIAQELAKHRKREGARREAAALTAQLERARDRSSLPSVDEIAARYWTDEGFPEVLERLPDVQSERAL
jgi:hypothetical protein